MMGTDCKNTGKCPRCHSFIIAEQLTSHKCCIPITDAKTIWFDWISDGYTDKNNDHVRNAQGLNGTLYGLIVCKHNPPHNLEKRWLGDKRDLLIAITLTFLLLHSFALVHAARPTEISQPHPPTVKVTLPYVR